MLAEARRAARGGHLLSAVRYCGRLFTDQDIELLHGLLADRETYPTRAAIAIALCEALDWRQGNGRLKDMSARQALLRMQSDGLIVLPAPARGGGGSGAKTPAFTPASDPREPITGSRHNLKSLRLELVVRRSDMLLWRELIARYHYLGYTPLTGARMHYLIYDGVRLLGAIGFGASAWKLAPRDRFIGWTPAQREQNLHLIVNNARFLLLPWVHVKYLASSVLALAARRMQQDWIERHNYRPVLLETFVDHRLYPGTSYKAANWIYVGDTQGRGKLDRYELRDKPIKAIFLYPLDKDFRTQLTRG